MLFQKNFHCNQFIHSIVCVLNGSWGAFNILSFEIFLIDAPTKPIKIYFLLLIRDILNQRKENLENRLIPKQLYALVMPLLKNGKSLGNREFREAFARERTPNFL